MAAPATWEETRSIDRTSPVPYYYQLSEILREEIAERRWKPNELIPSEAALTEMFGVSRSVTRKALDLLEGDGQVYRIKGKGTVVAQPKFSYEAATVAADWMLEGPATVRLDQIIGAQRVSAGGHLGKLLELSPRDDIWEITVSHAVDDVPASLTQMYLRIGDRVGSDAPPEFTSGGPDILSQLSDHGLAIAESQMQIEATRATPYECEVLGIADDSPIFLVSSLHFLDQERPLCFTRTVVRSDHFFFAVLLQRTSQASSTHRQALGLGSTRA